MSSNVKENDYSLPQGSSHHSRVSKAMSDFTLWYNQDRNSLVVPEKLSSFVEGEKFLSTKQVPSALLLRNSGSSSVSKQRELLLKEGFTLTEQSRLEPSVRRDMTVRNTVGERQSYASSLSNILTNISESNDLLAHNLDQEDLPDEDSGSESHEEVSSEFESFTANGIKFRKNSRYKIKYDDPWKIHAATPLSVKLGGSQEITVWSGDGVRLQDPIPPALLGPGWGGSQKNRVRFSAIKGADTRLFVIYHHTHWGHYLTRLCTEPAFEGFKSWAKTLRRRLNAFLKGRSDPLASKRQKELFFSDANEIRSEKTRAERLIELLKTVDGIFLQRYLCYPEEVWNWDRFDLFTLGNISYLLGDEFLDGELRMAAFNITTASAQLKRARKWFKMVSHRDQLETALEKPEVSPWCMQFVNVWRRVRSAEGDRKIFLIGLLSQTRGCGTPPPIVLLQSKVKFLRTVSAIPPKVSQTFAQIRRAGLEEIIALIPSHAFTGLGTKARVTVTTSACWENTRKNGGTTEEIRRILHPDAIGNQYPVVDLDSGTVLSWVDAQRHDSFGELIFWASLDQVRRTPLRDLRSCFLTVVKEPGKARSVTKARACLKIILDVVSKLCAEPLAKGIRSSQSGMTASNHGWNVFLRLFTEEAKDEVFRIASREETSFGGYVERTDTYEDLFVSSTDYEEATDRMNHEMASELAYAWMTKCGIPRILRSIVMQTCFQERTVFYHATGMLATVGIAAPQYGEHIRAITLRNGVLMGDPLTKVCLHLTNAVARHVGTRLYEADFYKRFSNANSAYEAFVKPLSKT